LERSRNTGLEDVLKTKPEDWSGLLGLFVGCLGALIESWVLSGDLNHRYPFKIMNVPPPEYYVEVANTLRFLAPVLAVSTGMIFFAVLKKQKVVAGLLPVIVAPLSYILGLWYFTSTGVYKDHLYDLVNFDGKSAAMRHTDFNFGAIRIMIFGVLVYAFFYVIAFFVLRRFKPVIKAS